MLTLKHLTEYTNPNSMTLNSETEQHAPSLKQANGEHKYFNFLFFYKSNTSIPAFLIRDRQSGSFKIDRWTAESIRVSWQI